MSETNYDEPWRVVDRHKDRGETYRNCVLTSKDEYMERDKRHRFVACVNFLKGVPQLTLQAFTGRQPGEEMINEDLTPPVNRTIIALMLAYLQTGEETPLRMLADEIIAVIDSNKPYVSRDAMEAKLLEIAKISPDSYIPKEMIRRDIYKLLGIHCGKCDGTGIIKISPYRSDVNSPKRECDNCNGTGKAPKTPIPEPDPPEVEETTPGRISLTRHDIYNDTTGSL